VTYRLAGLVVTGILGFAAVGCRRDSDPPEPIVEKFPCPPGQGGEPPNCGGSGGASSGGSPSGGSAGAAGSASAGGGMGGMSGGSGGGGGAGGVSGGGGVAGGGSGGSANGTKMSFFVTSEPLNGTGDLGGLAGADAHCKALATAANAVRTEWVAYLSVAGTNAASRIGSGPWYNFDEDVFAADLAALHGLPAITPNDMPSRDAYIAAKPADDLFMDENGMSVPSDVHDILTGSNPDGTVLAGSTCMDWTSDSADDVAMLGHSDTPANAQYSPSWNAAHASNGCDAASLVATGGEGRLYCFATD
jgi:hypothetical protein